MTLNGKYLEKQSGETVVEQCDIPDANTYNLADMNIQMGMVGSKGYKQFPIWGRISGNKLVQVVTPYEVEAFKEQTKIAVPQALQKRDVDGNPIFIIYNINNY